MARPAPRLSVCMPIYNGAATLERALESLLSQTYRDFELVVSDNASTDGTAESVERYARRDGRILYHRQEANLGAAANYRFVFERARGEFFFWAPCDDWWDPRFAEAGVACLDTIPAAVSAFGHSIYVDGHGAELRRDSPPYYLGSTSRYERLRSYCAGQVPDQVMYGLHRSAVFKDYRWYQSLMAEKSLILHLMLRGPVADCPEMRYVNYLADKSREDVADLYMMQHRQIPAQMRKVLYDTMGQLRQDLGLADFVRLLPAWLAYGKWHKLLLRTYIDQGLQYCARLKGKAAPK